jgi:uncharacterized protein YkwD
MRCKKIFGFLILLSFLSINGLAQDVISPVNKSLPKEALRSKYRIQIMESKPGEIELMQKVAKEVTAKFRLNTYIVRNDELTEIDAGDFSEKKFAKQRLSYIKKTYKKAGIVKSDNDSISEFFLVEKKKPESKKTTTAIAESKSAHKIEIRTIESKATEQPENFSAAWNDPKHLEANSAQNEDYLTIEEKKLYYWLNLVRMNPKLFADTYLSDLRNSKDADESSLFLELQKQTPLPVLKPNRKLFESAKCHATESGESGYVGHERNKCTQYFRGECCQYGLSSAFAIITRLLIDKGVPSLGHRRICLGIYTELGVSIQPHKSYGVNTVLDFK